jgi:hypothetical protein
MDSMAFLYIAFGSLAYVEGQILGKLLISLIAAIAIRIAIKK